MARASKLVEPQNAFAQRVEAVAQQIVGLKVDTVDQCVEASRKLAEAARLRREIEAEYKKRREPLLKQQREIIAEEKQLLTVIGLAESACTQLIKQFQRKEAEERAAKEAKERAEREAAARAEAQLRADQLRAAAAAAQSKAVAKRLEAQAALVETAQPIIDPVETAPAPKTLAAGVHTRTSHHAAVTDLKALVLQIAAGIMLKEYGGSADRSITAFLSTFKPSAQATVNLLQPKMPALNDLAKSFPTDLELQGVSVIEDENLVARN